ncbi:F-box domain-containing protein [Heracleum sosnowskyi]|uniref:F-box domain-containing protein n=1 Tax=Heracleum sosnowskyi TaxID=360622 RepID=A0AAD8IUI0_9APIA|nr:F-box domain-containing protein [Heracleum sosnowskyi]
MASLPCKMIEEILYRVPVKHLLRFRCVSKGWCSRIDSSDFAKKQFKTSLERNSGVGILINGEGRMNLDSLKSLELDSSFKYLFSDSQFVGASNGLMCVFQFDPEDLYAHEFSYFLNPITRKCIIIPSVPPELPKYNAMFFCGFGYDEVNNDFKMLMIAQPKDQFDGDRFFVILYSLKTNVWTRIQNVPGNISFGRSNPYSGTMFGGVFASGSLHWTATTEDQKDVIVAFDLTLEQFKQVPFPPTRYQFRLLGNLGQCLSIEDYSESLVDVWVMKYCGVERTWYKAASYNLDPESQDSISTVGIRGREFPDRFRWYIYTESLFKLPDISIENLKKRNAPCDERYRSWLEQKAVH